jgi:hypothetical protein
MPTQPTALAYQRTCFKIKYPSRKVAKEEMREINRRMKSAPDFIQLTDVYFCAECQQWHTTSMDKTSSRNFTRFKNNYMPKEQGTGKPKAIYLTKIPADVWEKICAMKRSILEKNKSRSSVSHEEAIYKLIKNNCA